MRRRAGLAIIVMAIISGIRSSQVDQRSETQPVFHCGSRHELPHALRDARTGNGPAAVLIKIAFLQRKIKELRRKSLCQHLFRNRAGVAVLLRDLYGLGEPRGCPPFVDVLIDFLRKTARHIQLAFSEDARYSQDQLPLLAHLSAIDVEGRQILIVGLLHVFPACAKFLDLLLARLVVRVGNHPLQVGHVQVQRLHLVEEFLRKCLLLPHLHVRVEGVGADNQRAGCQPADDPRKSLLLFSLNVFEGAPNVHRMLPDRRSVSALAEIVVDVPGNRHPASLRWSNRLGLHAGGLDLQQDLGTLDSQPDRNGLAHLGLRYPLAIYEHTVGAAKICDNPLVFLIRHLRVISADVFVFHADFAVVLAADSEGEAEASALFLSRRHRKGHFENGGYAFRSASVPHWPPSLSHPGEAVARCDASCIFSVHIGKQGVSPAAPAPRSPGIFSRFRSPPPACRLRSPWYRRGLRPRPARTLPPPENRLPSPATLPPLESDQSAAAAPSAPPDTSNLPPRCTGTPSPRPRPPPRPSPLPWESERPESLGLHT